MPALHQCRFDRGGIIALRTRSCRAQGGTFDATGDRRLCGTWSELCIRDHVSGQGYLRHIRAWRAAGYHVSLFFLSLPSAELAVSRVRERVCQGGHDIPEAVIRRRFASGFTNFNLHYRAAVDAWALYDNSGDEPILLAWGERV